MPCLPGNKYLILKVYCSFFFDCPHLKKGNFIFSQGVPLLSVKGKE